MAIITIDYDIKTREVRVATEGVNNPNEYLGVMQSIVVLEMLKRLDEQGAREKDKKIAIDLLVERIKMVFQSKYNGKKVH